MITNEKLRAVVSYTTPGGAQLSWTNNADLLIRDTSVPITYTAGFFTNNLATTPMSSVDEGGTAYIVLITTGVPDFTYLDWEITGAGITLDDTGANMMSGQAMIRTNTYWATITPKLDLITEGNETLTMTFKRDGVIVASASIVINDTSFAPPVLPPNAGAYGPVDMNEYFFGDNFDDRIDFFYVFIGRYYSKIQREVDPYDRTQSRDNHALYFPDSNWIPSGSTQAYVGHGITDAVSRFGFEIDTWYKGYLCRDYWSNQTYSEQDNGSVLVTKNDQGRHTDIWVKFNELRAIKLTREKLTNGVGTYRAKLETADLAHQYIVDAKESVKNNNGYWITMSSTAIA